MSARSSRCRKTAPRLLPLLAAGLSLGVHAGGSALQFGVHSHISQSSLIEVPQLDFGGLSGDGEMRAESFQLQLPAGLPYQLALDAGQHAQSQRRRMVHRDDSGSFLLYELFQDAAGEQAWGDGSAAIAGTPLNGVGSGGRQTLQLWARLPQGQGGARPGDYRDAITVTVSY